MSNISRVACVTGAASGIGLATAKALADAGFRIVIVDIKDEADGAKAIEGLAGKNNLYIQADISSDAGRGSIVGRIRNDFGRLDLLVNNAGVGPKVRKDILEVEEESYDRVMSINLKGPFFLTQLAANYMIELLASGTVQRSKIVNISSVSAYVSSVSRPEYCLSKAGVSMMTKLFADRLAGEGINVYEIRPGIIKTPMTEVVRERYDKLINEDGLLPISRWGHPEDIASAVTAIASGAFDYSTGQVFDIDGGFHLRRL